MPGPKIFKSINQIPKKLDDLTSILALSQGIDAQAGDVNQTRHIIHYLFDRAKRDSADFIYDHLEHAVLFHSHHELLKYAASKIETGAVWEFGVFTATSTNIIADVIGPRKITGFDSFQGLKEDWAGHTLLAGAFDLGSKLPKVRKNVELVPGWVQDTVNPALDRLNGEKLAFVHFDLDTYESTRFAMNAITGHLADRAIFVFDEYHSYPGWKHGEKKAFEEWIVATGARHRFIGFAWEQAAVEVIK